MRKVLVTRSQVSANGDVCWWTFSKRLSRTKSRRPEARNKKPTPIQNQDKEQQKENKPANKDTQVKAGLPAPDFSEMEDWFEIVRYEYPKAPDRNMWIYFKPKVDGSKRPIIFYVEFRDKDGILVQSADASPMCCSSELMETANGETAKVRVLTSTRNDYETGYKRQSYQS